MEISCNGLNLLDDFWVELLINLELPVQSINIGVSIKVMPSFAEIVGMKMSKIDVGAGEFNHKDIIA